MSQYDWDWIVSKVAADMDTTNAVIENHDPIMQLIKQYVTNSELTYEHLLTQANEHKQTLRR